MYFLIICNQIDEKNVKYSFHRGYLIFQGKYILALQFVVKISQIINYNTNKIQYKTLRIKYRHIHKYNTSIHLKPTFYTVQERIISLDEIKIIS